MVGERGDSAYLPRVTPLAVMAPISDDNSARLSLQVPANINIAMLPSPVVACTGHQPARWGALQES